MTVNADPMPEEVEFAATPLFGMKSRLPLVDVRLGRERVQMTSTKAALIGSWLLEGAEAALTDAFLATLDGGEAARLLTALRELRGLSTEERLQELGEEETPAHVQSLAGTVPLVEFRLGVETVPLEAPRAVRIGLALLRAATEAETDGAVYLACERRRMGKHLTAALVGDARILRQELRAKAERADEETS
jgi:hypothetical protein